MMDITAMMDTVSAMLSPLIALMMVSFTKAMIIAYPFIMAIVSG